MTRRYRVLPDLDNAADGAPGHPLFVQTRAGTNRIDNPDVYDTVDLGSSPLCADSEVFGHWAPR